MNNSVILGWGTVGKATADAFHIERYYSRHEKNIELHEIAQQKYIFVCLPTPTIDGRNYVDDITKLIKQICKYPEAKNAIFIIRSTVYPGYNRFLQKTFGLTNIVSNPEFLSEDTAVIDANKPYLIVVGGDDTKSRDDIIAYYRGRFKYCRPLVTNSVTAETIKYVCNVFFTTKIIFANEIYDYAQQVGANYEVIRSMLENHPWGTHNHLTVYHKGGRGASGKCLKKDMLAFATESGSTFFQTVYAINQRLLKESGKE